MTLNQVCIYIFTILPFFIQPEVVGIILVGFVGYLFIFESLAILTCKSSVNLQIFNPYVWIQLLSGLLKRASFLFVGYISGISIQTGEISAIVFAIIALLSLIANQFKTLETLKGSKNIESSSVLPYVERS